MKNTFSLVSTYINWSSLLPTPRARKANESCMVSAAHPLVKRCSYKLFRFSSLRNERSLDTDPHKRISPNHTGPSNCTRATGKCHRSLIVFTVAYEYGEVCWKLAN